MCCSLLASQQSKKSPFRFSPLSTSAVHFIFPTVILPKLQTIIDIKVRFSSSPTKPLKHNDTLMAQKDEAVHDQLADSLNDLFNSVSTMIKSQLQVLSLSLSLSLITLFFNKISGICVILGSDFEIRGRIMS